MKAQHIRFKCTKEWLAFKYTETAVEKQSWTCQITSCWHHFIKVKKWHPTCQIESSNSSAFSIGRFLLFHTQYTILGCPLHSIEGLYTIARRMCLRLIDGIHFKVLVDAGDVVHDCLPVWPLHGNHVIQILKPISRIHVKRWVGFLWFEG